MSVAPDPMNASAMAYQFSIGRIFADSFRAYGRNVVPFTLVALALQLLLLMIPEPDAIGPDQAPSLGDQLLEIGATANTLVTAAIEAALVLGTLTTLRGGKASFADMLQGLARFGPVAIASLAFGALAIAPSVIEMLAGDDHFGAFGSQITFSVAEMVLAVICCVYVAAIVVERKGPVMGLTRSAELSAGHRWSIFFIYLICSLAVLVVIGPFVLLGFEDIYEYLAPSEFTVPTALGFVLTCIFTAWSSTVPAVIYHHLRRATEGGGREDLASVFD